jgi:hypothetical protein
VLIDKWFEISAFDVDVHIKHAINYHGAQIQPLRLVLFKEA